MHAHTHTHTHMHTQVFGRHVFAHLSNFLHAPAPRVAAAVEHEVAMPALGLNPKLILERNLNPTP